MTDDCPLPQGSPHATQRDLNAQKTEEQKSLFDDCGLQRRKQLLEIVFAKMFDDGLHMNKRSLHYYRCLLRLNQILIIN